MWNCEQQGAFVSPACHLCLCNSLFFGVILIGPMLFYERRCRASQQQDANPNLLCTKTRAGAIFLQALGHTWNIDTHAQW